MVRVLCALTLISAIFADFDRKVLVLVCYGYVSFSLAHLDGIIQAKSVDEYCRIVLSSVVYNSLLIMTGATYAYK